MHKSLEFEQAVLGALLLDNTAFYLCESLSENDFYNSEHGQIFAAVKSLIDADKVADVLSVFHFMENKSCEGSGLKYLNELAQFVPSASSLRGHAAAIHDLSIKRRMLAITANSTLSSEEISSEIEKLSIESFQRGPKFKGYGTGTNTDNHRNAPKPHQDCLYGLIGEIAKAGSTDTEANPFAIAASALAYLGVAVGRGPYIPIGDDWNHARLNFVHVGRSSRGRKGTAKKLVINRIAKAVHELNEYLAPQIHTGGLSTREGLALLIHDGWTQGKDEIEPISDKRLLVVESEFANVLHQGKRDGNTLSTALRDAWDGISIKPAIKTSRVWASNPHIGILADITPIELRGLMSSRELSNGFANRFIFFWAEGIKVNPFPKQTPKEKIDDFARRVADILLFVKADRHVDRDTSRMIFSPQAASLYAHLYQGELRERSAGEQITGLLDRRAPTLMRLAMIFALTDLSLTVDVVHIKAAMAWIRYWVDSVKYIFQSALDEAATELTNVVANELIEFLTCHKKASRSEIIKLCFKGHLSKIELDRALDELLSTTPPLIEVETVSRVQGAGSPTKFYKLAADCAKSGGCEDQYDREEESGLEENLRLVRNGTAAFAEFAQSSPTLNNAENRMSNHISLNSQILQEDGYLDMGVF
jgi:hypothetical protein